MDDTRYKIVRKENLSDPGCDVKTVLGHEAAEKERVKMTKALTLVTLLLLEGLSVSPLSRLVQRQAQTVGTPEIVYQLVHTPHVEVALHINRSPAAIVATAATNAVLTYSDLTPKDLG